VESNDVIEVRIEVPLGTLVDEISILQIKKSKITNENKLRNVCLLLEERTSVLNDARMGLSTELGDEIDKVLSELVKINTGLWNVEDELRSHEQRKVFDSSFVELARSVYKLNDTRCEVKSRLNELAGSRLREEKDYEKYADNS
jgi:hypothetical protein